MPRIQGVGPRIAARLIEMGFAQPNGKPDVRDFAETFKYDKTLFYEWVADRRTPTKDVARLCRDLQVAHGYLLYGEGQAEPYKPLAPIRGGSGAAAAPMPLNIIPETEQNLFVFSTLRPVAYQTHPIGRRRFVANPLHGLALAA